MQGIIPVILQRIPLDHLSTCVSRRWDISHLRIGRWEICHHGMGVSEGSKDEREQKERSPGDIDKCQRFPSSSSSPINYIPRCIRTSHFPCIQVLFLSLPAVPSLLNYMMEGQVGMMHEADDVLHGGARVTTLRWLDTDMSRTADRGKIPYSPPTYQFICDRLPALCT